MPHNKEIEFLIKQLIHVLLHHRTHHGLSIPYLLTVHLGPDWTVGWLGGLSHSEGVPIVMRGEQGNLAIAWGWMEMTTLTLPCGVRGGLHRGPQVSEQLNTKAE